LAAALLQFTLRRQNGLPDQVAGAEPKSALPRTLAFAENPFITLFCRRNSAAEPGFPQHRRMWQQV